MMLDTTQQFLQRYVVSIPTLIVANVGIPLSFTFALVKDTFIYKDFFETFQNAYGIKISDHIKVIESDQEKALRSFIQSKGFQSQIKYQKEVNKLLTADQARIEKVKVIGMHFKMKKKIN